MKIFLRILRIYINTNIDVIKHIAYNNNYNSSEFLNNLSSLGLPVFNKVVKVRCLIYF